MRRRTEILEIQTRDLTFISCTECRDYSISPDFATAIWSSLGAECRLSCLMIRDGAGWPERNEMRAWPPSTKTAMTPLSALKTRQRYRHENANGNFTCFRSPRKLAASRRWGRTRLPTHPEGCPSTVVKMMVSSQSDNGSLNGAYPNLRPAMVWLENEGGVRVIRTIKWSRLIQLEWDDCVLSQDARHYGRATTCADCEFGRFGSRDLYWSCDKRLTEP